MCSAAGPGDPDDHRGGTPATPSSWVVLPEFDCWDREVRLSGTRCVITSVFLFCRRVFCSRLVLMTRELHFSTPWRSQHPLEVSAPTGGLSTPWRSQHPLAVSAPTGGLSKLCPAQAVGFGGRCRLPVSQPPPPHCPELRLCQPSAGPPGRVLGGVCCPLSLHLPVKPGLSLGSWVREFQGCFLGMNRTSAPILLSAAKPIWSETV